MTTEMGATDAISNGSQLATRFLDALGRRDFEEIDELLAPNVWFRALLPRKSYEFDNAGETLELLESWFGKASELRVLKIDHHGLANRDFILYRFGLFPDWAPQQRHVIEQAGFLRAREGSISRLDLVCTGFFPSDDL